MTEHLMSDARKSISGEINLLQSPRLDLRMELRLDMGVRAMKLLHSHDTVRSTEHSSNFDDPIRTGGVENMTDNQEGVQNAELFKQMYDAAIDSIDGALQVDVGELSAKIPAMLSSIDALRATPYVSSVPEFVAMTEVAKSTIETVDSLITLDGEDSDLIVANALLQAKQQLAGTLIAYGPRL